ncbi:MAG TPA: hypothetical protein VE912_11860, partial [Bacteroidales bacterium]|nr:hypothetical protein [Bacteroidales bacterium]
VVEFLKRMAGNRYSVEGFIFNGSKISFEKFVENDQAFENFKNSNDIHYWSGGNRNTRIAFEQIEEKVDTDLTYDEREAIIEKKNSNVIERLKEQKEKLKKKRDEIESKSLEELLQDNPKEKVLGKELSENNFLVLLLRNGYIDEQYEDYISFFYEGSLKISDKKFLQNVKSQTSSPFDYELVNLNEILKRLRPRELSQKEVLNHDLVDYLLENNRSYQTQLDIIFNQLSDEENKSVDFVDGFTENKPENTPNFIRHLTQKWIEIWLYLDTTSESSDERKEKYLDLILRYSNVEDILKINEVSDDYLRIFISQQGDFIEAYEGAEQLDRIQEVLNKLSVKFKHLTLPENESQLFNYIYENDLYQINNDMISLIIEKKSDSEGLVKQLESANYSAIKKSECGELISYIENNIVSYVDNILLKGDKKLNEEESFFTELLNNEELSLETKNQLINKQTPRITNIKSVSSELWEDLLSELKVEASWKNLVKYYSHFEKINEPLITFLNAKQNYNSLAKTSIDTADASGDVIRTFVRDIILAAGLKEKSFKAILKSIPIKYDDLNLVELSDNKVQGLVKSEILNLTVPNYNRLKEKFSPYHIQLIVNNIDSFLDRIEEFNVNEEDLKSILNESEIKDSNKLEVFESFFDISQLTLDPELADLFIETLLANQPYQISYRECKRLIDESKSKPQKIKLITSQLDSYNRNQKRQLILSLSYPHSWMVKSQKRPKLRKKEYNLELVRKLNKYNIISSFDVGGDKIKVNAKVWKN